MKKITLLMIFLLLACAQMQAQEVKLTFQLNLNQVTDMHPGGSVWVLFDDWSFFDYMEDSDQDGIYTFSVDTTEGTVINYSFSYQTGPDEWNDYVQETVPEGCAGAAGYREIAVPAADTTLPAFYYETCSDKWMSELTFSVDLRGVDNLYQDGGVWIYTSTDWAEWADMADDDGDSIYTATVTAEGGTTLPYIFSYQTGPDAWTEYVTEDLPAECKNADGFREVSVPQANSILPVLAYESCEGMNMVHYRVDLSGVGDLHDGGSVWLVIGAWDFYFDMIDEDGDLVYSITLETEADTAIPYYFSYQNGPDADNDYVEESVPAECANENGYRSLIVEDGYTVLPPVAFGSCTATPPSTIQITFSVDMSAEVVENNDVQVVIKGDWWIWTALVDQGNGIWSAAVDVSAKAGDVLPYTFVNGGQDYWGGEEKLPDDCNAGSPSAPERQLTVEGNDTILNLVAFGSCTDEPVGKANVTFSVDMSRETVSPDGVQLVIKGPWIWTALVDQGNGIWEVTVPLNASSTYPYTFVNGAMDNWDGEESVPEECNFGTFSAPERRVEVGEDDLILPTVSFGACSSVSDVNITFRVDMTNETVSADGIQLVIKEPWIWVALSDAGDGIWEATVTLESKATYPYSFVNGAKDYWSGEEQIVGDCKDGENNQRLVNSDTDLTLPAYIFGTCEYNETGISEYARGQISVYPNPASTHLYIRTGDLEITGLSVFDARGRRLSCQSSSQAGQIQLDVSNLSGGLYLLVLEGTDFRTVSRVTIQK